MDNKALQELAQKVAPLIGYDCVRSPNENMKLAGEKGALYMSVISYGPAKGRIHIGISWPSAPERGYRVYTVYDRKDRKTDITVSGTKTAEQIAKDIKNRFLADAESLWLEANAAMQRDIEYHNKRKAANIKLAELTGNRVPERYEENRDTTYYVKPGEFTNAQARVCYGNEVKFEFTTSLENAERVIEFIRSLKKEPK